jgi:toxin ParE1/3/4
MGHARSSEADSDLDDIWYYVASESGSVATADRFIDTIAERFYLLAEYPHLGRRRDAELRPGLRSFSIGEYVIIYRQRGEDILVLRVLHGSRDIVGLLGH